MCFTAPKQGLAIFLYKNRSSPFNQKSNLLNENKLRFLHPFLCCSPQVTTRKSASCIVSCLFLLFHKQEKLLSVPRCVVCAHTASYLKLRSVHHLQHLWAKLTSNPLYCSAGKVRGVPAASVQLCLRSKTCTKFDRGKESKMRWPMPENSGAAGSSAVSLQLQGVVAPPLFRNTQGYNPSPCWTFSVQKLPRLLIFWPYRQVRETEGIGPQRLRKTKQNKTCSLAIPSTKGYFSPKNRGS